MNQANQTAEAPRGLPAEGVDQELLDLPAPPRARRLVTMTVMALTVVVALALIASLRADISYFFASERVSDLGEAAAVDPAGLEPNSFVRIAGTPMASGTVRYTKALGGTTYAVFPLAGQRAVFVQVPLEGPDAERNLARREFSGRLVTFGQLGGRFDEIRGFLGDEAGMPVSSESFLLMADEPPGSYGWALFLAGLCLLFVVVNVALLVRWFRPLPVDRAAPAA